RDPNDRLDQKIGANISDLPTDQYWKARRFLGALGGAIRLLENGHAGKYLGNDLADAAKNVKDLVKYMKGHGLEFKPAVDGQQDAYAGLHHALATYDVGGAQQMVAEGKEPANNK